MASASAPLIRHVSRRDLAQNRSVWLATGGMYAAFALLTVGLVMWVDGLSVLRMQVMACFLAAVAIIHLTREPPAIGTVGNHLVLLSLAITVALSFWVYEPGGGVALGAMLFVGPLTAVRLQDRRQIVMHMTVALTATVLVALVGDVGESARLAVVLLVLASAVLCYSCMAILEAAEAQGDELELLVRRDPLTGIGNRRLLDERLADAFDRMERTGRPLSLIALDLDGHKIVRDDRGHPAGDALLRDVAEALTRATDPGDTLVRQGGDEFSILLPDRSVAEAERTANAVRAELATLGVRCSLGIASSPDDALQPHVLLHLADERLRDQRHAVQAARRAQAAAPASAAAPRPAGLPGQGPGRIAG